MKRFIQSKLPKNENEVLEAIFEFQKSLTIDKCQNYISHLKKVKIY